MTEPPKIRPASAPVSRVGCVVTGLAWLCVMTVPLFAFILAMKGELTWRRGAFVEDRVWLVNAESGGAPAGASGLGYSATRPISNASAPQGVLCARTQVYFILWRGRSENVAYCECYTPTASGGYESSGSCP